ncbi:MAG: hypothetical protein JHC93_08090 [Parachlamydiales bacterium]|nr:hypothetical protein [Parachlamydiales bacterium]
MKKSKWIFILLFAVVSTFDVHAKIYDCFTFFNELDILKIRLDEMYDHVDHFVLVESAETFRGNPKPAYFNDNQHLFTKWADKIIYVYVEDRFESESPWPREAFQRNQIMRGLVDAKDDDIVLISDVDEIVRGSDMPKLISSVLNDPNCITGCIQQLYHYYINRKHDGSDGCWNGTQASSLSTVRQLTPQQTRVMASQYLIENSGWHFSSMGRVNCMEKIKAFSHFEDDTPDFPERLVQRINGLTLVPIDSSYPRYILENVEYFENNGFIDLSE